jgi:hypothetical protein
LIDGSDNQRRTVVSRFINVYGVTFGVRGQRKAMKIYLAGPLFSTAERDFNSRLAGLLREMKSKCGCLRNPSSIR